MNNKVTEIFGIAGSGKTTYACDQREYELLTLSRWKKAAIYLWAVFSEMNVLAKSVKATGSLRYIRALSFVLYKLKMVSVFKKKNKNNYLYDQGPIFNYVLLRTLINYSNHSGLQKELDEIFNRIKNNLDESIYLECDLKVAIDRIFEREKNHIYKNMSRSKALKDLELWQQEYDRVAELLASKRIHANDQESVRQ
ncbi:hypothetical protein [Natronogracilivirga saccharolytica]|uniref:Uncharacterized protein n=1 Tax=Natronogracilivirga saccharolytica TaxID=2812953 RepID=A0A8J7S8I5_9BACT|nr:hypothetical protein [Natronogracilivirga saccharolytica]MBP3193933.1 hypothetical protein [Natronogracilivirga saccharolytica]